MMLAARLSCLSLSAVLLGLTLAAAASPSRPAPVVPKVGAVSSGVWRNMFVEAGYAAGDVQSRLSSIVAQLLSGNPTNESLIYASKDGSNATYLWDVADNDVRTEGMSYGMMDFVQLNNQSGFDRLFRWYKSFMQHPPGDVRAGYASWHCSTSGSSLDANPASDGETFVASALLFAAARWGDAGGVNYTLEAGFVLRGMLDKEDPPCGVGGCDSVVNMFGGAISGDGAPQLVVFVPYASAASYTDPSYLMPFFYEQWASAAATGAAPPTPIGGYWRDVANASRALLSAAADPTTGLSPDYSTFAGAPTGSGKTFSFDAWRVARNAAVDYAWYAADERQVAFCNKLLSFFRALPTWPNYGNQFDLDGRQTDGSHSPGLVAMNAVCALASNQTIAWDFIDQLWNTSTPSGQYRYYDGVLFLEAWLHLSGNFRAFVKA